MHVNINVTVKTVGGISLCDGGKLEDSRIQLLFRRFLCVRIEIDQLLSQFVGQL